MKRYLTIVMFFVLAVFMSTSCNNEAKKQEMIKQERLKRSLERANRFLVKDEEEGIHDYISRHKLDMVSTGTGLRYQVLYHGTGDTILPGQLVTLEYTLKNIMGDVIYTSENEGYKTFVVGHGDVESGIDEAVRYLHQGDVALVIIPSHLGYGLLGDRKSIPGRATLFYMIKVVDVKDMSNQ